MAAAGVEHRHVGEQLLHEGIRLGGIALVLLQRKGIGGEIGIARVARGLGVGEDDLDVIAHEVGPILDVLGVARAHQEGREGIVGRGGIGESGRPVLRHIAGPGQRIHVDHLVEGDHVRLQPLDDGARLAGGAGVGLVHRQFLAGLALPEGDELGIDGREQLAGDVIGDVEERVRTLLGLRRYSAEGGRGRAGKRGGKEGAAGDHGTCSRIHISHVVKCYFYMHRV